MEIFKKNNDMKIIEKDVGFLQDLFGSLKDMIAYEDHCFDSFASDGNEQDLKDLDWMRRMRTFHLDLVSKEIKGHGWCKVKHLCRIGKGLQEESARFLSIGNLEKAKECAVHYKEVYLKFVETLGYKQGEINMETKA